VIDADGNLRIGDRAKIRLTGNRIEYQGRDPAPGCDVLIVDTADGSFAGSTAHAFLGQPVRVDGAWYRVELSDDGSTISAGPAAIETGRIRVGHDVWSMLLVGTKHVLKISGGRKPIAVPADRYAIVDYRESSKPDPRGRRELLRIGRRAVYAESVRTCTVRAKNVARLKIGSPLTCEVVPSQADDGILLTMAQTDAFGDKIDVLRTADGKLQPAPAVEIYDRSGELVHVTKLEYG